MVALGILGGGNGGGGGGEEGGELRYQEDQGGEAGLPGKSRGKDTLLPPKKSVKNTLPSFIHAYSITQS